jgi:DNA-binding PadR family transcriptional regulator
VSITRLMALGLLARSGPMHGHAIRREAEQTHVESWGGVAVGALYRELHAMEREGLILALRSERAGRRPARTVYEITPEGRRALEALRSEVLADVQRRPDGVGVALLFARGDPAALAQGLRARRQRLEDALAALRQKRARLEAAGGLDAFARAVFRRGELALQGEIAWHQEFEAGSAGEARAAEMPTGPLAWAPAGS